MKMISHNIRELDGYKGLGILAIMAFTCFWFPYSFELIQPAKTVGLDYWLQGLFGAGWVGIDLFIVVTGFLCTQELLVDPNIKTFLLKRARRVLPAYFLFVILWIILAFWLQPDLVRTGDWLALVSVFTFTNNFLMAAIGDMALFPTYLQHLWTIALAMQFFLLWPFLMKLAKNGQRFLWMCIALVILLPPIRAALIFHDDTLRLAALVFTPLRLDSFAWGALLALATERFVYSKWIPGGAIAALLGLILFFILRPGFNQPDPLVLSLGLSILGMFFATTLAMILPRKVGEIRNNLATTTLNLPLLGSMGRYSYGIYLLHQPVTQLLLLWAFLPGPGWASFLVFMGLCMGISLLLSMVSFQFWERRFLE